MNKASFSNIKHHCHCMLGHCGRKTIAMTAYHQRFHQNQDKLESSFLHNSLERTASEIRNSLDIILHSMSLYWHQQKKRKEQLPVT